MQLHVFWNIKLKSYIPFQRNWLMKNMNKKSIKFLIQMLFLENLDKILSINVGHSIQLGSFLISLRV